MSLLEKATKKSAAAGETQIIQKPASNLREEGLRAKETSISPAEEELKEVIRIEGEKGAIKRFIDWISERISRFKKINVSVLSEQENLTFDSRLDLIVHGIPGDLKQLIGEEFDEEQLDSKITQILLKLNIEQLPNPFEEEEEIIEFAAKDSIEYEKPNFSIEEIVESIEKEKYIQEVLIDNGIFVENSLLQGMDIFLLTREYTTLLRLIKELKNEYEMKLDDGTISPLTSDVLDQLFLSERLEITELKPKFIFQKLCEEGKIVKKNGDSGLWLRIDSEEKTPADDGYLPEFAFVYRSVADRMYNMALDPQSVSAIIFKNIAVENKDIKTRKDLVEYALNANDELIEERIREASLLSSSAVEWKELIDNTNIEISKKQFAVWEDLLQSNISELENNDYSDFLQLRDYLLLHKDVTRKNGKMFALEIAEDYMSSDLMDYEKEELIKIKSTLGVINDAEKLGELFVSIKQKFSEEFIEKLNEQIDFCSENLLPELMNKLEMKIGKIIFSNNPNIHESMSLAKRLMEETDDMEKKKEILKSICKTYGLEEQEDTLIKLIEQKDLNELVLFSQGEALVFANKEIFRKQIELCDSKECVKQILKRKGDIIDYEALIKESDKNVGLYVRSELHKKYVELKEQWEKTEFNYDISDITEHITFQTLDEINRFMELMLLAGENTVGFQPSDLLLAEIELIKNSGSYDLNIYGKGNVEENIRSVKRAIMVEFEKELNQYLDDLYFGNLNKKNSEQIRSWVNSKGLDIPQLSDPLFNLKAMALAKFDSLYTKKDVEWISHEHFEQSSLLQKVNRSSSLEGIEVQIEREGKVLTKLEGLKERTKLKQLSRFIEILQEVNLSTSLSNKREVENFIENLPDRSFYLFFWRKFEGKEVNLNTIEQYASLQFALIDASQEKKESIQKLLVLLREQDSSLYIIDNFFEQEWKKYQSDYVREYEEREAKFETQKEYANEISEKLALKQFDEMDDNALIEFARFDKNIRDYSKKVEYDFSNGAVSNFMEDLKKYTKKRFKGKAKKKILQEFPEIPPTYESFFTNLYAQGYETGKMALDMEIFIRHPELKKEMMIYLKQYVVNLLEINTLGETIQHKLRKGQLEEQNQYLLSSPAIYQIPELHKIASNWMNETSDNLQFRLFMLRRYLSKN